MANCQDRRVEFRPQFIGLPRARLQWQFAGQTQRARINVKLGDFGLSDHASLFVQQLQAKRSPEIGRVVAALRIQDSARAGTCRDAPLGRA